MNPKRPRMESGFLLIDKPSGMTSRKVLDLMMRSGRYVGKAGHAGTLDPLATGLLILCFGRATRLAQYLIEEDKRYFTSFHLGEETDTCDREGQIVRETDDEEVARISEMEIKRVLKNFTGTIEQVPPRYSARKVNGRRSYELAREGRDVDLRASTVAVKEMKLISWEPPILSLSVLCSTGTYVRALARDIGRRLGVGAHVSSLQRTAVGPLTIGEAIPLEDAIKRAGEEEFENMLLPIELPLRNWSRVKIDDSSKYKLINGSMVVISESYVDGAIKLPQAFPCRVGIWEVDGDFIGVGRLEPAGSRSYLLYPEKVITAPKAHG